MAEFEIEKVVQKRFFGNLINQDDMFGNTPIEVYQELVYQRYYEVIKNNFPLFIKQIDKSLLEESIKAFMKDTPMTPFIWQMPKDYIKFVKKNKYFEKNDYLYEVLYFDWVEVEIYMKEYRLIKLKKISYNNKYKLAKSARIKRFEYDIINQDFSAKRENFLIIYYDFIANEVIYREINQLIYELLKRLNKKESIGQILKQLCKENEIDFKEAQKVLKEPLTELLENRCF